MKEQIEELIREHLPKLSDKKMAALVEDIYYGFDPDDATGFEVVGAHIACETIEYDCGTRVELDIVGNVVSVRVSDGTRIEVTRS